MKERIRYLDFIKCFAIVLVIYCHYPVAGSSVLANMTLQFTTTVGVPLFLMVNGAILLEEKEFHLKRHLLRTLSLFIVSVAWKLIYYLIMLTQDLQKYSVITKSQLFCYFSGQNITSPWIPAEHFWFLYALIGIYLLFPLIKSAYDEHGSTLCFLMLLLFIYIFVFNECNHVIRSIGAMNGSILPDLSVFRAATFPLLQGADLMLYFLLGGLLHRRYYVEKRGIFDRWKLPVGMVASFALLLFQRYLQQGSLRGEWVNLEDDYQRIGTLGLTVCLFLLVMRNEKHLSPQLSKFLAFVSERTMNIYAVHMILCALYMKEILPVFSSTRVLIHAVRTVGILMLSILVTEPLTYLPGTWFVLGLKPRRR